MLEERTSVVHSVVQSSVQDIPNSARRRDLAVGCVGSDITLAPRQFDTLRVTCDETFVDGNSGCSISRRKRSVRYLIILARDYA